MGTPIIVPEPGGICYHWEPPAETPEFIYAVFWDILKGDHQDAQQAPNEHIFKLHQRPLSLCRWEYINEVTDWEVSYYLDASQCTFILQDTSGQAHHYFSHTKAVSPPDEYELFTNSCQSPFCDWGYKGYGMIFWMDEISVHIIDFGLDHVEDLKLELFGVGSTDFIVKLCSNRLNTNIKFKISR